MVYCTMFETEFDEKISKAEAAARCRVQHDKDDHEIEINYWYERNIGQLVLSKIIALGVLHCPETHLTTVQEAIDYHTDSLFLVLRVRVEATIEETFLKGLL